MKRIDCRGRREWLATILASLAAICLATWENQVAGADPSPTILDGVELPDVKPTPPAAVDEVAQQFKVARATYEAATVQIRTDFGITYRDQREKVAKGEFPLAPAKTKAQPKKTKGTKAGGPAMFAPGSPLDPKVQSLQQFDTERNQFYADGTLPSHPAMKEHIAAYEQALKAAEETFRAAIEKALAAYAAAGVNDPAKLKPILGQQAMLRHAGLLGVWEHQPLSQTHWHETWIISVDSRTGDWQADGIDLNSAGGFAVFHGDKVRLSGSGVSFVALELDGKTNELAKKGVTKTLRLKQGKLQPSGAAVKGNAATLLQRTNDDGARKLVAYHLQKSGIGAKKGDGSGPAAAPEKVDLNDANAVWRELAALSSFAYYRNDGSGPFWGERLYIPYRSSNLTVTPGVFGFLGDAVLGRSSGAGVNQGLTEDLMRQYDHLAEAPHPYLRRAADRAQTLSRARCQLALADEQYGNTPASSVRQFISTVAIPAMSYVFQREADRAALEGELQRQYPAYQVIVYDAPMSDASLEHLSNTLRGAQGIEADVEQRAFVSSLLSYADMAEVDRQAEFWKTMLLPLAERCGGPVSSEPLVEVEGVWRTGQSSDRFQRLNCFHVRNVSGQDLTHAVVEVLAENQWGGKAAHYLYLPQLEVGEYVLLAPHYRWKKRQLHFTNKLTVASSIWADQGTFVGRRAELASPAPDPNAAATRQDYLAFDREYKAKGEAWGAAMQAVGLLPVSPTRQKRLLVEAAAPGKSYVFRLANEGESARPLVLRFLRRAADASAVEAEIVDLASKKPLKADAPLWKGALNANRELGYIFRFDSEWTFQISPDDRPVLSVPAAPGDQNAVQQVPLLPVKT